MRRAIKHLLLVISFMFIIALNSLYADAGTALMWFGFGHLIIGNFIIGAIEGIIIAKIYKIEIERSGRIMVLANYVSMVVGLFGVTLIEGYFDNHISINNAFIVLIFLVMLSYILTILIEWPFCLWVLKERNDRKIQSLKASLAVNTLSYALLIPAYLFFGGVGTNLITDFRVDKTLSFLKTKDVWVYNISPKDGAIYKIRADGANNQKIVEPDKKIDIFQIYVCKDNGKAGLYAYYKEKGKSENIKTKLIFKEIKGEIAANIMCNKNEDEDIAMDFRPERERNWRFYTSPYMSSGLSAENKKLNKDLWLTFETPFLSWRPSDATVLPEDQVIFSLNNQIVIIDINSNKIGLITFGKSPVVVIEKK